MIGGRKATQAKRKEQAKRVAEIIDETWAPYNYKGNYIVLGDFNDYPGTGTALNALIKHPHLQNVLMRLPKKDRWTHYWAKGDEYNQLDYILLSKDLVDRNPNTKPEVYRQGMPLRAGEYMGEKIVGIGANTPKASDHAGLIFSFDLDDETSKSTYHKSPVF